MVAFALFVGFVVGALAVIGVEVVAVLLLIQKLSRKAKEEDLKVAKSGSSESEELPFSFPNKQGWVWILDKEKIPKTSPSTDKGPRPPKRKIDVVEVSPVRKHATIKDTLSLILTEQDGTLTRIPLKGCTIEAVSATNSPSRKWAKKYPVKVEHKSSVLYHGSKLFYLYFETSSEKESWCKALRLASCDDKEKLNWFYKSRSDFHNYLGSLNVEYPSFLKPSIGFNPEIGDKSIKIDTSSSKVRNFLKKLAKKTSKTGREDKKVVESNSGGGSTKLLQTHKKPNHAIEEKVVQSLTPRSTSSGSSRSQAPFSASDIDSIDKIANDDGTLCCNLLISRLFFDAKSNADLKSSIQARIQRTLSTIRTPSYIGEILCTGVNPGNIPPYIHGMRVLPSDLKEVVAMEIDIEYYGGAVLDIETRLEVQELENPETISLDSKSVNDVTSDLLEEYYEEQLKLKEQTEQKGNEIRKLDETKSFNGVSKWKSVLNSVANKVSQVPLTMAIRVTTLRGTVRVHIKPPPSDQLWFGFTSMPDIDFSLESSVGDHKITSGHIALFIIGKFKAAIRDTMVLPNSESVTIPFMLAEKNDWVPQKVAPFIWTNPETTTTTTITTTTTTTTTAATATTTAAAATTTATITTEPITVPEPHAHLPPQETHPQESQIIHSTSTRSTDSSDDKQVTPNEDLQDEKTPLLESSQQAPPEEADLAVALRSVDEKEVMFPSWQQPSPPPQQMMLTEESNDVAEGEDARLRRIGTRAKMLGLRKKMGEKLEEKRRNIEEKGRHIVEKMRGPERG